MVELRAVSYQVGEVRILDDVSVQFRPGRFSVVLGPNGAGKSTLVRLATGLARPTSGSVCYDGRPVSSFSSNQLARRRAVLSQRIELAFPLPAADVVMMGRYPHYGRVPSIHDRDIVRDALDLVGMIHKREQPYSTLSGGEQQKVQLARVLAQIWPYDKRTPDEPRYVYLDEPTTSLDVHYQLQLLDAARGLLEFDCTVVAILHDLNVAFRYGDYFILLEKGRVALAAEEIPADVLERVYRVRARRTVDPEDQEAFWRFRL